MMLLNADYCIVHASGRALIAASAATWAHTSLTSTVPLVRLSPMMAAARTQWARSVYTASITRHLWRYLMDVSQQQMIQE